MKTNGFTKENIYLLKSNIEKYIDNKYSGVFIIFKIIVRNIFFLVY